MTYTPQRVLPAPPPVIWCGGRYGLGRTNTANVGGAQWPTVKKIIYVPIFIDQTVTITQIGWVNGGITNGNVDAGVYEDASGVPGAEIASTGSTAQSGATAIQTVNVTDFVLPGPATYWLAITFSGTGWAYRMAPALYVASALMGAMEETVAGDFGLPATATPVTLAVAYVPFVGLLVSPRTAW